MSILEWLSKRDDGLGHLRTEEQDSIVDFALLWIYVEARLLQTDARPDTLTTLADRLQAAGSVDHEAVRDCYEYFRERYWTGNLAAHRLRRLRLTPTMRTVVETWLAGSPDARGKLIVCLFVIFRYRNNLFHGNKWVDGFEGQKPNLDHATQLLHAVIALDDTTKTAAGS